MKWQEIYMNQRPEIQKNHNQYQLVNVYTNVQYKSTTNLHMNTVTAKYLFN